MERYRCYFLNNAGTIVDVEVIQCPDDHAAWRQAVELLRQRPKLEAIELWNFARKVIPRPS
jgi:hypothetical protein